MKFSLVVNVTCSSEPCPTPPAWPDGWSRPLLVSIVLLPPSRTKSWPCGKTQREEPYYKMSMRGREGEREACFRLLPKWRLRWFWRPVAQRHSKWGRVCGGHIKWTDRDWIVACHLLLSILGWFLNRMSVSYLNCKMGIMASPLATCEGLRKIKYWHT